MGIYMDNAATTMQKPDCVIDAVVNAMKHMGNSGRGAHEASLDASRLIYETREMISDLVHLGNPKQVAFTCNSTEALNTAILGLFGPGDHILSTVMEHNPQFQQPNSRTTVITVILFLLVAVFVGSQFMSFSAANSNPTDNLITSEFVQAVEQGRVEKVVYAAGDYTVSGTYYPAAPGLPVPWLSPP